MRGALASVLVTATLFQSACTQAGGSQTSAPAAPSTARSPVSPLPAGPSPASSSDNTDSQAALDHALQEAAARLGLRTTDLRVELVEARQWGDSSLGCPRPGELYSQVVTPGFLIVLSGSGKQLEYHSDARGRVVLCREG